ncbi:MAG: hypothetical protein WAN28_12620 [Terracidiphilus sp.]
MSFAISKLLILNCVGSVPSKWLVSFVLRIHLAQRAVFTPERGIMAPMHPENKKRLHAVIYGLYYPAVLGTGLVVALQRISAHSIHGAQISVALVAGIFFSLSFASAIGFEEKYTLFALLFDVVEVILMFLCLDCLSLIDISVPLPKSIAFAYGILLLLVGSQLAWRASVKLKVKAFLDLKLIFIALLVAGIFVPPEILWAHWLLAALFLLDACLYVANRPYDTANPARTLFFVPQRSASQ